MFRDSCWNPEGEEEVVHEYQILGTADPATGILTSVTAVPRVLPYAECPGAAPQCDAHGGHRAARHAPRGLGPAARH